MVQKLYSYTVEFFRTLDIPVRTLNAAPVIWRI